MLVAPDTVGQQMGCQKHALQCNQKKNNMSDDIQS